MFRLRTLLFVLMTAVFSAPASAGVEVTFTAPEHYTDAIRQRSLGPKDRDWVLSQLQKHLERLGARYLPAGQTLKIDVLDVDLAGDTRWEALTYDIRVVKSIYGPSMNVHYTLEQDGRTLMNAEERVSDRDFLMKATNANAESLDYERTMLTDWFRARFVRHLPPPRQKAQN